MDGGMGGGDGQVDFGAVGAGGFAGVFFEEFAKGGGVTEVQEVGDLLEGVVGIAQ